MAYAYVPSDIAVFAQDEALILLVEVKPTERTTAEWAAQVRRDTLQYRRNVPPESMEPLRPTGLLEEIDNGRMKFLSVA